MVREGRERQTMSAGKVRGRVSGNRQYLGAPATSTYPRLQVLSSRFSFCPRAVAKETYCTHAVAAATCHMSHVTCRMLI
jgi:hypothetical protein